MKKLKPKNILFYIWIGFSTLSAAVSLASLLDGIIAWAGFIRSMIESYRHLVDGFWGAIFSIFDVNLPSAANDYLTLSSLFAVSISWGFYKVGNELGFGLSSVRQFIQNNLFDFTLGGNSFQLFKERANRELPTECGGVSSRAELAMNTVTRGHPKMLLTIDGVLSSIMLILLMLTCSFVVPYYLKWKDLRWNRKARKFMLAREVELRGIELGVCEKPVIVDSFNSSCVMSTESEKQILMLYHSTFRRSIWLYLVTVGVIFAIMVFLNYVIRSI